MALVWEIRKSDDARLGEEGWVKGDQSVTHSVFIQHCSLKYLRRTNVAGLRDLLMQAGEYEEGKEGWGNFGIGWALVRVNCSPSSVRPLALLPSKANSRPSCS